MRGVCGPGAPQGWPPLPPGPLETLSNRKVYATPGTASSQARCSLMAGCGDRGVSQHRKVTSA